MSMMGWIVGAVVSWLMFNFIFAFVCALRAPRERRPVLRVIRGGKA